MKCQDSLVPGVQIVEGGKNIQEEEKKNAGRLEGEMGREQQFVNNVYRHSLALASRLVPPPLILPVYNLTRSPLTAAL